MMGSHLDALVLLLAAVLVISGIFYFAYYRRRQQNKNPPEDIEETKHISKGLLPAAEELPLALEGESGAGLRPELPLALVGEVSTPTKEQESRTELEERPPKSADPSQCSPIGEPHEEFRRAVIEIQEPIKARNKARNIEPIQRGGRPRSSSQDRQNRERTNAPPIPKPEIICWKRERMWVPAVEVPEELLENPGLTVRQNGSSLPQEASEEALWRLEGVAGKVTVRWNDDDAKETAIELGQENYLLFKLSGPNLDQGRRVRSPSSGSYLVMAPDTWERDETLSGSPTVMPEHVSLDGYKAHFFDFEKDDNRKIAFRLPNDERVVIESKTPQFELVGNRIEDATEHMGPLFGERPPRIRALDAQAWNTVKTIVVGEEGRVKKRWRTSFSPDPSQTEQDLPPEVADRKGGWYFMRFYNSDDDLIESLDFRFLSALRGIKSPPPLYLPQEEGHQPAYVEILHEDDCQVQPVNSVETIPIERQCNKTILTISPHPTCDETQWSLGPEGGPKVEITINIERIWWAVGEENIEPSDQEWQDKLLKLSREDFRATSRKALWLRLPRRHWVDKVLVGFERSRARPYLLETTKTTVPIPLRDFGDSTEVDNQSHQHSLGLWIKRDDQDIKGVLAILPASPTPAPPLSTQALVSFTKLGVGLGRKKTAKAKAVIKDGTGDIKVNGRDVDDYFKQTPHEAWQFLERLRNLQEVSQALSQMEINISVEGSSPTTMRQAKAVAHAIARALMSYDHNLTAVLKQAGFGGIKVREHATRRGKR